MFKKNQPIIGFFIAILLLFSVSSPVYANNIESDNGQGDNIQIRDDQSILISVDSAEVDTISPDYDWTHNQSCFHTKQFTYLYSEKINIIEDGFLYLPEFPRLRLTIRDQDGNEREDGETIKTGDRLTEWRDGKFEVLSTFIYLGDVEADGQIDAADARKTLRAAIGLIDLSDTEKEAADLDNDGAITSADARTILRESVHLKTNVAKKGNSREDYFYRTSLLVWMQEQDCDARIAALRSTYDEITDVRILAEEYISDDSRAVIVLLNVETYQNKNSLAEKIKDNEKNIIINSYSLL